MYFVSIVDVMQVCVHTHKYIKAVPDCVLHSMGMHTGTQAPQTRTCAAARLMQKEHGEDA